MSDTDMLYMASLEKRNAELEARIAELEDKHWNECRQIAHYEDELRKAKELLKATVETINEFACGFCMCCKNHDNNKGYCMLDKGCQDKDNWEWVRKSEALALIGEDGEQNDT